MDKIAVIDFGGQYAHLIANRIRRLGVYSEILDPSVSPNDLLNYKGIILSGGPASVLALDSPKCDVRIFTMKIPILGICYGHQLIAYLLEGEVGRGDVREYGHANVEILNKKDIFEGLSDFEDVWMSHFDQVMSIPEGFEIIASSEDCAVAGMANFDRQIYSIQFHPEVTHTEQGRQILENFVELTDAKREWNIDTYVEDIVSEIKEKVGENSVFLLVSGGVDSTVAFLLIDKALGQDKVYGLFVDIGFMRLREREEVENALKRVGVTNLHVYDAGKEYFEALKEVYEPEKKREIIGNLFLDIQAKVSDELGLDSSKWILAQGTIYPDTIETGGTKHADTIKTHHNRVPKIQKLIDEGKVIEPLAQLYKDEVRIVGEKLGLAPELVWRHPFPGPGLAVRCLCALGDDYPEGVSELETKMKAVSADFGMNVKILPVKSVGVQGDERTYRHPAVVYGEQISWDELSTLSTRLTNQFPDVNRVLYGLAPEGFHEIKVKKAYLTEDRIKVLQKADKIVMDFIAENGMNREIWQFPTVLVPLSVGGSDGESVVLRPVCSEEAMTANFYEMEFSKLDELKGLLMAMEGVDAVFYDITNKPPGTIEWE